MSENETTPKPTQTTETTSPEAAPAEAPKAEQDWKAAYDNIQSTYVGMTKEVGRMNTRYRDVLQQNAALADAVGALKGDIDVLTKQSLGEDQFKQREEQRTLQVERAAALKAAATAREFIPAAIDALASTMRAAGVTEQEIGQVFLAARETANVAEWNEAVKAGTAAAISRTKAAEIAKYEATKKNRSDQELKAEASALAERELKKAGVDKIDTGQGAGRTTFAEKVRGINRESPEFAKMLADAKAGRLKV